MRLRCLGGRFSSESVIIAFWRGTTANCWRMARFSNAKSRRFRTVTLIRIFSYPYLDHGSKSGGNRLNNQ
jgi:hypothetical protein